MNMTVVERWHSGLGVRINANLSRTSLTDIPIASKAPRMMAQVIRCFHVIGPEILAQAQDPGMIFDRVGRGAMPGTASQTGDSSIS